MKRESLLDIGKSISQRRDDEIRFGYRHIGIARAKCTISGAYCPTRNHNIWLTTANNVPFQPVDATDITINKNTKLGGAIIMGKANYGVKNYVYKLDIYNYTTYTPAYSESKAKDITVKSAEDDNVYQYRELKELLNDAYLLKQRLIEEEKKKKRLEEEKRKAQEQEEAARKAAEMAAEEERRKLEEEARRLEELRKQKEEEERKKAEEIARLEAAVQQANKRAADFCSFIRNESTLRLQHTLDPSQEEAKRSHIYDGVPIIIEGGPGTGKTTTMIQRLKFLLDVDALKEYDSPLTEEQKQRLTEDIQNNWLFFSPTPLLLRFLMNNMNEEGLSAVEGKNIITLDDFRRRMLSTYHLYNMDTNGPFRNYNQADNKPLIKQPDTAIKEFEKFCIKNSKDILLAAAEMNTSNFDWHSDVLGIKSTCKRATNIKDIEALMRLFNSLYDNERKAALEKEKQLAELVKNEAHSLLSSIKENESLFEELRAVFQKWEDERLAELTEVEEDEMDESNEEENAPEATAMDFEPRLFSFLKSLLRQVAFRQIDTKKKLSARQKTIFEKIENLVSSLDLREIGQLVFYSKRYAFLCKGIESNIINQLPRLYKVYRKKMLANEAVTYYDRSLLARIVNKDNNKHLHKDEQDLLIGFINNLAIYIRKRSKDRYAQMVKRCKYIKAYEENKKPVIGIDEATDYTVMDYYMMYSFRHYEYSSITLSGDLMQGLHKHGIRDWDELKLVIPELEVVSLRISYRQIPTLVKMAKDIYFAERGEMPSYDSRYKISEREPQPLMLVSDDQEEKIEWIALRLCDVYKAYDNQIPSVAIFLPNGMNVDAFVKELSLQDRLSEIKVSAGKETSITKAVKVYELSEVKGMEFEVAFFYDLDEALKGDDKDLMKRHLYVGISRATSHLAAIFNEEENNEELFEYFTKDTSSWKI